MQIDSFEKLRCPTCLGGLELKSFATDEADGGSHVESGLLLCEPCRIAYPVESDTPVMLRFSTPFHHWFATTHGPRLQEYAAYSLPSGTPRTGEASVQETFTDEWNLTRDDELSFNYTFEQLVDLNRRVWLRAIAKLPADERPTSMLDVGCGAGMETIAVREATGAKEVFGIDLNFALLSRRDEYRRVPGVNFVVASLFDLPFERESFDLVYSQGVLHHTYSTAEAFRSIAPRVRRGGNLFIWVYGLEDHLTPGNRRWKRRHHATEWATRPFISRSPRPVRDAIFKTMTSVSHARKKGSTAAWHDEKFGDKWQRANTEHALRDWLSPRYAHRHGFNEVTEWFEAAGFRVVDIQSPAAYRELFAGPLWGVGMTGERLSQADSVAAGAEAADGSAARVGA